MNTQLYIDEINGTLTTLNSNLNTSVKTYVDNLNDIMTRATMELKSSADETEGNFRKIETDIMELTTTKELLTSEIDAMNQKLCRVIDEEDIIIKLNVSGRIIETTKNTLCVIEGSVLSNIFKGQDNILLKDENGFVFLDFNPDDFCLIIDYLRGIRYKGKVKLPRVSVETHERLYDMCDYLGILPNKSSNRHIKELGLFGERKFPVSIAGSLAKKHVYEGDNIVYTKHDIAIWTVSWDSTNKQVFLGIVNSEGEAVGWSLVNTILRRAESGGKGVGTVEHDGYIEFNLILVDSQLSIAGHNLFDKRYMGGGPEDETHRLCIIGEENFSVDLGISVSK